MDYEYWLRISKKCSIAYLPELLAASRNYPETKTLKRRKEVLREIIETTKIHFNYVPHMWIYNYAVWASNWRSNSIKLFTLFIWLFVKHNKGDIHYLVRTSKLLINKFIKMYFSK